MTYRIRTRTEIGLPAEVTSSSGSRRPRVNRTARWLTIHYTGVDVAYGDHGDTDAEILGIQDFAVHAEKPFEYNYVIHQDDDDVIHEYAGEFRAAHSGGENSDSFGVLLLNGVNEPPTTSQIDKVRWLRAHLIEEGRAPATVEITPHLKMPEAATACPGPLILARLTDMAVPWNDAVVHAPPQGLRAATSSTVTPGQYLVRDGDTWWGIAASLYGHGSRWNELDDANDSAPTPGARCNVPGFAGHWVTVEDGWGEWQCIRAAAVEPSAAAVHAFQRWNGGDPRADERGFLQAGERVFVPVAD